jgi:hypothetical protein
MPRFKIIQTTTWVVDAATVADLQRCIQHGTENTLGSPTSSAREIQPIPISYLPTGLGGFLRQGIGLRRRRCRSRQDCRCRLLGLRRFDGQATSCAPGP